MNLFAVSFLYFSAHFVVTVRILCIFPVPFHSHHVVFQALVEELSRNGNQLVVLTAMPHEIPLENVREINVQEITQIIWDSGFEVLQKTNFALDNIEFSARIMPTMIKIIDAQISSEEMQAIIRDKEQNFDVILLEASMDQGLILSHIFKAPVIQVSTDFGFDHNFLLMDAPVQPVIFPDFTTDRIQNPEFWEQLSTLYNKFRIMSFIRTNSKYNEEFIKKHLGDDAPSMNELRKNIQMLFLNVHDIWDNNRPVPPSIVYTGAMHLKKPEPLPQDLKTYLDSSAYGVIYMSLGSHIRFSDLPEQIIKLFRDVFASIPYNVLIKWNGGDMADIPDNVRLQKVIPQNDMLHHPKVKAFIMQGGLQDTQEAIAARVPLLALPVMTDQWYNARKLVQFGVGRLLTINELSEDSLRQAILKVAEENSFRNNIERLSRVMEEQRVGGLQKAVYWTEYVARHGVYHLKSPLARHAYRLFHARSFRSNSTVPMCIFSFNYCFYNTFS